VIKLLTVESNVHECLVCGRGISHNQTTIRYHIRNHGLTMNLYYEQNKTELEQDSVQLSVTDQTLIEKTSKRKSLNNSAYEVTAHDEINEWLNRCVYTCKLCSGYETNQFGTFVSHLKSSHNVPIKSYREQNNGEVTTKYVQHTCQICSSVFAWDKQMLRRHLSSNHSHISANDYALKYRDSYSDNLLLEEQENETAQWMDGCSFDCKECNECKFNSRKSLLLHLKSAHEMTSTEYFKKYRHFSSSSIQHTCKICDTKIKWERDAITSHLAQFHSMTPESYAKCYQIANKRPESKPTSQHSETELSGNRCPLKNWNDRCSFSCQICYITYHNRSLFKTHLKEKHSMSHTYYCDHFEAEMVQKTVHSCLICGKDILFDSDSMKNHIQKCHSKISIKTYEIEYFNKVVMKTDLGENDWMHRCQYDCKICAVSFREKEELEQHILDEHSMRLINYTSIHGSGALAEVYHTCQVEADEKVCNQKVLWGEQSISNHLSNKHNLSPTDYHNKYMNDYDSNLERTYKKKQQEWANKCSFLCKICNQMFDTKDKLKIHTKEEHKNSEICSSEWDQTVAKFLLHTCQICQENVLWEKEAVTNHLKSKHGISKLDYASKYLESYEENEECQKEMKKYDDWMNRCIFQCLLCESHVSMTRKSTLISHIRCRHKEDRLDYFGRFKDETMTKAVHHVCQICTKSLLWDESAIQKHIKLCHELTPEIYKAKFMSSYTEDTKLIEKLRREDNHQLFVATKTSSSELQEDVQIQQRYNGLPFLQTLLPKRSPRRGRHLQPLQERSREHDGHRLLPAVQGQVEDAEVRAVDGCLRRIGQLERRGKFDEKTAK